jgi:glycosyltransferase involved in cell wall biosynthesis
VVLHPLATRELPKRLHPRVRVIFQSANTPAPARGRAARTFDVAVLAHLRPVKDPLRAARAARLLPASSRVRILHLGAALDERARARAQREQAMNPRYLWVGTVARGRALRVLSRCRLLVLSSRLEGGANVVSEALAASVPVISSRIPGSIGILGRDYPGYFPVGDTRALSALLRRAETNRSFYRTLRRWCRRLRPLVAPARERAAWARVLRELPGPKARSRAPR